MIDKVKIQIIWFSVYEKMFSGSLLLAVVEKTIKIATNL